MKIKVSNETLIGVFGALALTLLILGYNFLKGNDIFSKSYYYYAVYDQTDGIAPSNPVIYQGLKVGSVKKLSLIEESGKIVATLQLNKNMHIPIGTVAKIISSDLLGSKAVDLIFPKQHLIYHNLKDTVIGDNELSFSDQVSKQVLPVKLKAEKLLESLDSLVTSFQVLFATDALQRSVVNLSNTIENLNHSTGTVDSLLTSETSRIRSILHNVDAITHNLKDNNARISAILKNTSIISDSLAKADFVNTINQSRIAIEKTNAILTKVNDGNGTLGMLVNDQALYNNLTTAASNLDKLMVDLKENPTKYINISIFGRKKTKDQQ